MLKPFQLFWPFARRSWSVSGPSVQANSLLPMPTAANGRENHVADLLQGFSGPTQSRGARGFPDDAAKASISTSRARLLAAIAQEQHGDVRGTLHREARLADRRAPSSQDDEDLHEILANLSALAFRDELTGLQNRRGFMCRGAEILAMSAKAGKHSTLLYADVDNLKHVNDFMGHCAGDDVLVRVSEVLKATFRETDVIGRLGGDEFVALTAADGTVGERSILIRLRRALARENLSFHSFPISLSVGLATFDPGAPTSLEELIVRADGRMYSQKKARPVLPGSALVAANDASFGVLA
jgi:diguanylate cyclase (GGDEF)-like protein